MTDVQLRRHEIAPGKMDAFLEHWQELVQVREKYGFTVLFGFANRSANELTWALSYDGDFDEADKAYKASAEHQALLTRMRSLGLTLARHSGMVDVMVAPRAPAQADPRHD